MINNVMAPNDNVYDDFSDLLKHFVLKLKVSNIVGQDMATNQIDFNLFVYKID